MVRINGNHVAVGELFALTSCRLMKPVRSVESLLKSASVLAIALLLVAASFASFGNGVLRPALTSLITQQVSRGEQGVVLGRNQSLMSIAQIVGPAIAGALIDRGWLSIWAFWTALITLVALVLNRTAREARNAAANHLERA